MILAVTDPLIVTLAGIAGAGLLTWLAWMMRTLFEIVKVIAVLKEKQDQHGDRLDQHEARFNGRSRRHANETWKEGNA